jgi:hypothetical protein
MARRRLPEVPGWVVGLALGATAIGVGGYIAYEWLVGPRKYLEDQYRKLFEEYVREYAQFVQQTGGALTKEQEAILSEKQKRMSEIEKAWRELTGSTQSILTIVGVGLAVGIVAYCLGKGIAEIVKARRYAEENAKNVQTTEGAISYIRCTVNVALAELGYVNIATAAQIATNVWASTYLYPTMQTEINLLQAQLATLTGVQLMIAQFLINALTVQMTATIPAILQSALLYIMPPPVIL